MITRRCLAVVMAALVCLVPAAAVAADATTGRTATSATPQGSAATTGAPTPPASLAVPATLDIQLWPSEPDGVNLVVSAEIPASVKLPATIRIPLPAGVTIGWVGEVFGGDVADDIERPYTTENGQGGQVLVVSATKSHVIQYEGVLAQPALEGSTLTAKLAWVQSAPSAAQTWAVKMLANTAQVKTTPAFVGAPQTNAVGERLYTLPSTALAAGTPFDLTVTFTTAETSGTPAASGAGSGSTVVLTVLFALLAAAVITLMVVAARGRRSRA